VISLSDFKHYDEKVADLGPLIVVIPYSSLPLGQNCASPGSIPGTLVFFALILAGDPALSQNAGDASRAINVTLHIVAGSTRAAILIFLMPTS
jgi:hypothetical protein